MKNVTFISHTQTLEETFKQISPRFQTLLTLIPEQLKPKMGLIDRSFCRASFILANEKINNAVLEEPPKTLEGLLEEAIRECMTSNGKNYVQCQGQEYRDFKMQMKSFNFARTLLQTIPTFKTLFSVLPYDHYFYILINYVIIIPYKEEYIQVAGKSLPQKFNMKAIGFGKKVQTTDSKSQMTEQQPGGYVRRMEQKYSLANNLTTDQKQLTNNQSKNIAKANGYASERLNRMQIFYCSTMNRNPGLFSRNIFFDKGIRKSQYINQVGRLTKTCIQEHFIKKMTITPERIEMLTPLIYSLIQRLREVMHIHKNKGKNVTNFAYILINRCPLPKNYKLLKERVNHFIKKKNQRNEDGKQLFNDLYAASCPYRLVVNVLAQVLQKAIPQELIGRSNKKILQASLKQFISRKRFQMVRMQEYLSMMDIFQLEWLKLKYNKKYHKQIINTGRRHLSLIIAFIINHIIVPLIQLNFYVTQKHKEANKIFYYRKPVWILISRLAVTKFSQDNLELLSQQNLKKIKSQKITTYPEGKLRILPKLGTFRPIITFNRKIQFFSDNNPTQRLKANLNQILADTQLVLRNLKNILGEEFGYCIFDNRQISRKYDKFIKKWRQNGSPPLKYFAVDIKKCYDSIDTSLLLEFIENTQYIEDYYLIVKYNRLYRNKRPLHGKNNFTSFFNFKERVSAVGLSQDPMEIREEHKIPSINVFPSKQKLLTKKTVVKMLRKICEGSIVSYRKHHWLQKVGIPQGLNVSGVLCSLYFAHLEDKFVNVKKGLLMRLTDDYLYIGPEDEAVKVLDGLIKCSEVHKFKFSEQKIFKNFDHPRLKTRTDSDQILWIGKIININTLEMRPKFQMNQKVSYAMNVNIKMQNVKSFLKNKFKSLLTNHFSSYYKPKLFPFESTAYILRHYTEISLQKFTPFIFKLMDKMDKPQLILIQVFKSAIHQFLMFACMLAEQEGNYRFYLDLYMVVTKELIDFFERRMSNIPVFINLKKIFNSQYERVREEVTKDPEAIKQMEVEGEKM